MKKTNYRLTRIFSAAAVMLLPFTASASAVTQLPTDAPGDAQAAAVCQYMAGADKAEVVKYLLVWDNEGACVSFPLSEHPRIVSDVEKREIKCITTMQEVSFSMSEVHKYTLSATSDDPSSIEDVQGADDEGVFRNDGGTLRFDNFKPGSRISVYTLDGVLVAAHNTDAAGCLSIPVQQLGTGIYLIRTESVTYKIVLK